jgi:hypothetical protein
VPLSSLTPADGEALGQPVRRFIADHVILLEQQAFAAGVGDKLRCSGCSSWLTTPASWPRKLPRCTGEAG